MKTQRKPLSKTLRFEIFKRDNFTCQYCGAAPPQVILHIDHIKPVKLGGTNEQENLIASCSECNLGKKARELTSIPKSLEVQAQEIKAAEKKIKANRKIIIAQQERIESEALDIYFGIFPTTSHIKIAWVTSIKSYMRQMSLSQALEAAEIAASKYFPSRQDRFSYFCGICKNKIKEANNGKS